MNIKTIIISSVLIILAMSIVIADLTSTTSNILTTKQKDDLNKLGINQLTIKEYSCSDKQRCFELVGDINKSLVKIPDKVSDGYKYITKKQNITYIKDGKQITRQTNLRIKTTEKVYRDITDEEVNIILDNQVKKLAEDLTKENPSIVNHTIKYGDRIINLK